MDTKHLVDPELSPLLELFPYVAITNESLPDFRARMIVPMPVPENDGMLVEKRTVPGPKGAPEVPIIVFRPEAKRDTARGAIFHIHGGGYIGGTAASTEIPARILAKALDCVIVSVDYRLAPETRFPGNVEDCYAALAWTFANAAALGIDTARIGVKGESAGGGLAAALALLARDRGEVKLAFQHLIYPMLDDRTCAAAEPHKYTGEFIWPMASNVFGWTSLLGAAPGAAGVSPYAAPARAEKLEGLPPTFIMTGALDLFLEEDMEYARRLMRAGIPTELHVYPGAFHGFDFVETAAVAQAAKRDGFAALKKAVG